MKTLLIFAVLVAALSIMGTDAGLAGPNLEQLLPIDPF